MYESHFGLRASPFRLGPDTRFYFESRSHAQAMACLKFGTYQAEGFIVVTGDVGTGKTMLVRALLEGLDQRQIVSAQVVSSKLSASELLRAIAAAFGVPLQGTSKASHVATLEAFFTAAAAKGRRTLLVIDEAQNLGLEALEELRMLSNFQIGHRALLQSFLVGQPELRRLLRSDSMEQLRQRVIASGHLGPLQSPDETQAYVEHRLGRVGWSGRPAFAPQAYLEIHRCSGAVPRRINLLCNRLLLAAFLESLPVITAAHVERLAAEIGIEVGFTAPPLRPRIAAVSGGLAPLSNGQAWRDGRGAGMPSAEPLGNATAAPRRRAME